MLTHCIDLMAEGLDSYLVFVAFEALNHNLGGKPGSEHKRSTTGTDNLPQSSAYLQRGLSPA